MGEIIWYNRAKENGQGEFDMSVTQTFYDDLAPSYDKLFLDWQAATREQAEILDQLFRSCGFDTGSDVLDCACGIGTQSIGLAALGYAVTASDLSEGALAEAKVRAEENGVSISFARADFCALEEVFARKFDIVICMDNALPHMLSKDALKAAVGSITARMAEGGIFVASIRDYDALLAAKPPYSPPYIHKGQAGQRVAFQTWDWEGEHYRLVQYIIEDGETLGVSKFVCEYRATRREELTEMLKESGCREVKWLFPEESGFYQPIVIAKR